MDKIKLRKIRDTMLKKLRKSFMQALQSRVNNHISLTNPEQIFYDTYRFSYSTFFQYLGINAI